MKSILSFITLCLFVCSLCGTVGHDHEHALDSNDCNICLFTGQTEVDVESNHQVKLSVDLKIVEDVLFLNIYERPFKKVVFSNSQRGPPFII